MSGGQDDAHWNWIEPFTALRQHPVPNNDYFANMEAEANAASANAARERLERCREVTEAELAHARNKGKRGELELAKLLTKLFGVQCRRGQQYSGLEGRDVVGLPGVHIESKRVERLNLIAAYDQACRDAGEDDVPVVCHRHNLQPWFLTVAIEDLPRLVERLYLTLASEGQNDV